MSVTKDQIMGALPNLSQNDLLAIKTLASALLQQGATDTQNNPDNAQGWLFAAMAGVLNMGGRVPDTLKAFNKNAPIFIAFIAKHFEGALNRKVDALAVMHQLLGLLVSDLKARDIPVTASVMINHLPRIAEVFEAAFPGYLASGLGGLFQAGGKGVQSRSYDTPASDT